MVSVGLASAHPNKAYQSLQMNMQIIVVGVTNKKKAIYSFRGPFWTALTHVRAFSLDF